jgi:hypothetical protein
MRIVGALYSVQVNGIIGKSLYKKIMRICIMEEGYDSFWCNRYELDY